MTSSSFAGAPFSRSFPRASTSGLAAKRIVNPITATSGISKARMLAISSVTLTGRNSTPSDTGRGLLPRQHGARLQRIHTFAPGRGQSGGGRGGGARGKAAAHALAWTDAPRQRASKAAASGPRVYPADQQRTARPPRNASGPRAQAPGPLTRRHMLFGRDDKREPGRPTQTVPLLPLRDIIVFPHQVVPLFVGREKSIAALKEAMAHKGTDDKASIFLAAQKQAKTNDPGVDAIYAFGTLGHVIQLLPLPDGTVKVLVEGVKRARVRRFVRGDLPDRGEPAQQFFVVEVEEIEEQSEKTVELEALVRSVHSVFEAFVKLNKRIPPEMLMQVASIDDPARLADTIAVQLSLKLNDRQSLLETENAAKRLEKLYELMQGEIEILQVEKKIRTRVKKQMEKTQKEYYLNEQMQAIQKELGERDEFKNEVQEIEEKLRTKRMSKEATLKV